MRSIESINGLTLPKELLELIRQERWPRTFDAVFVQQIFPGENEIYLYTLNCMLGENKNWPFKERMFLGTSDPKRPPGDIDPRLSILIGDFGIGSDAPFALDYRLSRENPRVLRMQWNLQSERGCEKNWWSEATQNISRFLGLQRVPDELWWENGRWLEVAPDFSTFADLLRL